MKQVPSAWQRFKTTHWIASAALIVGCGTQTIRAAADRISPRVGDSPPPLLLGEMVQGPDLGQVTWPNLRGKVVVLEFWDTQCYPCIQVIPHWNELVAAFSAKPVVFLAVSDDNRDALKRFLGRKPMLGWLALDRPFGPNQVAFGVTGIPHTVIIDPAGKIVAITHPAAIQAHNLDEILQGKPSTLPLAETYSPPSGPASAAAAVGSNDKIAGTAPTAADSSNSAIAVSIRGPFPQPKGAYAFRGWTSASVFTATKCGLMDALVSFYRIGDHQVVGAEQLPVGLYDIEATGPAAKMSEITDKLVEELRIQFGIKIGFRSQPIDVYILTRGPSLHASGFRRPEKTAWFAGGGERPGGFYEADCDMQVITQNLEEALGRTVVDQTGLRGHWDIDLNWEMSPSEFETSSEAPQHPDPSKVIAAVKAQTGLFLEPATRDIRVLVVTKDRR